MTDINVEYVKNLHPVFTKPKRIKIIVGGRGSTKSTGIADYVAAKVSNGELWCCARENQNSIEESVHRTILDEISRLGISGFDDTKTSITHAESGGRTFYRGLARNITSLKSTLSGIDGLWIEEGEDISANTLRVLTASVRLNAKDSERLLAGEDVKMPEIIITMNRGARTGAVAQKWLARAEKDLKRCGYYEDGTVMIVQMNYTDMPKSWFEASGLEQERLDDYEHLSRAAYDHKWLGAYIDEVENSIIKPEWFDAAIDAHKLERLKKVFEPHGAKIASHDPSDSGNDSKGFALRYGSIIQTVQEKTKGEIDEGCDWATGLALKYGADWFIWDGDGMGAGLKRQVSINLDGTKTQYTMFRGSLSGKGQDNAERVYQAEYGSRKSNPKTYMETFKNNRAQYYIKLADRFYNTYRCVVRGEYVDPSEMISLDSDGIENIELLRSECCRVPRVENSNGLEQIMNKKEMKSNGIESPNLSDSIMMCLFTPTVKKKRKALNYGKSNVY
ncbi:MAG: phage terminase large subunit [Proteobacteria bacterium]|nr:phage terminase large subunit [Pseudomonadota bacterium]